MRTVASVAPASEQPDDDECAQRKRKRHKDKDTFNGTCNSKGHVAPDEAGRVEDGKRADDGNESRRDRKHGDPGNDPGDEHADGKGDDADDQGRNGKKHRDDGNDHDDDGDDDWGHN